MDIIFKTQVGKLVGTDAALIFSEIARWVHKNKANDSNFHDGKYWAFNTKKGWVPYFEGYFTERQIKYAIDKLKKAGLIERGEYNKLPTDRTSWYTLTALGWSLSGYEFEADTQRPFQQTRDDRSNGQPVPALTNIITYQYNNIPNNLKNKNARTREEIIADIIENNTAWVENQIKAGIEPDDIPALLDFAYDYHINTKGEEPGRQQLMSDAFFQLRNFKEHKRREAIRAIDIEERKRELWKKLLPFIGKEFPRPMVVEFYKFCINLNDGIMYFEQWPEYDIEASLRQHKVKYEQRNQRTAL